MLQRLCKSFSVQPEAKGPTLQRSHSGPMIQTVATVGAKPTAATAPPSDAAEVHTTK
jgi:hypothetical protein